MSIDSFHRIFSAQSVAQPSVYASGIEVLDQEGWQTHFGFQVEDVIPPLPQDIQNVMASLEGKKNSQGEDLKFSLILMPKGLDFEKLQSLVEARYNKFQKVLLFILEVLGKKVEDSPIEESYWMLISNSDIAGCQGIPFSKKLEVVESEYGSDYHLPRFIEGLVSLFFQIAISKEAVYHEMSWAYTLCEEVKAPYRCVITGASKDDLDSEFDCVVLNLDGEKGKHEKYGVAVCRRFQ